VFRVRRHTSDPVRIDPSEILAWRWISPESLQAELAGSDVGQFTPWFVMEWERIWRDPPCRAGAEAIGPRPQAGLNRLEAEGRENRRLSSWAYRCSRPIKLGDTSPVRSCAASSAIRWC